MHQLVHAPRTQSGPDSVHNGHAGIYVADELRRSLACVCALSQQYDLGLLQYKESRYNNVMRVYQKAFMLADRDCGSAKDSTYY